MADKENEKDKDKRKPEPPPETKKGGCLKNIFFLSLLALVVLGGMSYLSFDPQDLTDIHGYRAEPDVIPPAAPDILGMLKDVSANDKTVRITEQQLNLYLRGTLNFEQEGLMKDYFKARGVWVRLEDDVAEVIIERDLMGKRRHTISMFLRPEQKIDGDGAMLTKVHRSTGRWGRVKVYRGFMLLTKSSFEALAAEYSKELKRLQVMFEGKVTIKITKDYIELQPPK